MKEGREKRIAIANEIIQLIATTDRCFLERDGNIPYFEMRGNKLWYVQHAPLKPIRPYNSNSNNFEHFNGGGTLWGLINDMREYIMQGKYSNGHNGYDGLYCSHWGYTKEGQEKIILKARELGYI